MCTNVSLCVLDIVAFKPDLVITEKGVSDLAQHFLLKSNISVIRRVRKTDTNRIARYSLCDLILYLYLPVLG